MGTDVREAAERLMKPEPVDDGAGMWRQAKRITTDYQDVAGHVLAEMDETLADWDFFQSIGGSLHADGPDFKYAAIRTDLAWCRLQTDEDGLGFYAAFRGKGEGFNIINPTRGQVLTALRLFGIPAKRSEK